MARCAGRCRKLMNFLYQKFCTRSILGSLLFFEMFMPRQRSSSVTFTNIMPIIVAYWVPSIFFYFRYRKLYWEYLLYTKNPFQKILYILLRIRPKPQWTHIGNARGISVPTRAGKMSYLSRRCYFVEGTNDSFS